MLINNPYKQQSQGKNNKTNIFFKTRFYLSLKIDSAKFIGHEKSQVVNYEEHIAQWHAKLRVKGSIGEARP